MIPNRIFKGKILSIVSTSLEKRLTIRPNGVMSKSSIGQRITYFKSVSCIVTEEYMQAKETANVDRKLAITEKQFK